MKSAYRSLGRLLHYAAPHRGRILLATLCSTLNKLCDIVPEILIGISIDVIVNQQHSIVAKIAGITDPFTQLFIVGGLTALLWIFESVFEYLYTILWRGVARDIQQDLRIQTYAHLQNLDMAYFEDKTTGGLLSILKDDIAQLEEFLSEGPNAVIQLAVNIIALGALFIYLSPVLALCAMAPIPFVVGIAYYFQDKLAALYGKTRELAAALSSHIAHRLQGIATIKSYVTQQYEIELLRTESAQYQQANYEASRINAAYIPTVRMAIMVGFIATLIVGGCYALWGYLPINWYAALVFLTQRFLWPFTSITSITQMYERSMASARRVFAILDTSATIKDGSQKPMVQDIKGDVRFDNVSFAYSNGKQLFNNLSLEIPAGKTAAFVGTTGSGKSTIIKLLLRFYDAQRGTVSIDNYNVHNVTLDALRQTIALVSQDTYMVDGTIADNIAYGTFNATRDEIIQAAQMAEADSFIRQLPHGYDTAVGENGKNLSGGQRQRIAIARAILKKSPILIFDEATSAVDNETEAAIQKSFAQLANNHTMLIVAHRLSTVRQADIIYVMEHGAIVEQGNHDTLLQKNGVYAKLWNLQMGGK